MKDLGILLKYVGGTKRYGLCVIIYSTIRANDN